MTDSEHRRIIEDVKRYQSVFAKLEHDTRVARRWAGFAVLAHVANLIWLISRLL